MLWDCGKGKWARGYSAHDIFFHVEESFVTWIKQSTATVISNSIGENNADKMRRQSQILFVGWRLITKRRATKQWLSNYREGNCFETLRNSLHRKRIQIVTISSTKRARRWTERRFLSMNLIFVVNFFYIYFALALQLVCVKSGCSSCYFHSCARVLRAFGLTHQHRTSHLQRNNIILFAAELEKQQHNDSRALPDAHTAGEREKILFSTDLCDRRKIKPHCYFACRNDNTLFWISPPLRRITREKKI